MAIRVHILRSKDRRVGFCFEQNNKNVIYSYQSIDMFEWKGHILKVEDLDTKYWTKSMNIFLTSSLNLLAYDKHIISWARNAGIYSPFEELGVTNKSFAEETIHFFQNIGEKIIALTTLRVDTYHIAYTRLDRVQMRQFYEWCNLLQTLNYTERDLIDYISMSGSFYYKTIIDEESRYYYVEGVRIEHSYEGLSLEATDIVAPAAVIANAGVACPNTSTGVIVGSSTSTGNNNTSGGLLIAVLLFTILIVLIVIAVLILEYRSTVELIGPTPISSAIPSIIPT